MYFLILIQFDNHDYYLLYMIYNKSRIQAISLKISFQVNLNSHK